MIDIATMKITIIRGEVYCNNVGEIASRKTVTRLTWIPGNRPVNVPAIIPTTSAITNSNNIVFPDNFLELSL